MSRNPPISISIPFLFTLLSPYLMPTMASTPAPSSIPQVDFSRMGSVGLGGSFSGLDWWSSSSPFASSSTSATFSTDGDTVFVRQANGSYAVLGSTNSGGTINALCWSNSSASDSSNGTLYIGGSFSSIGSTSSSNIVACSLSDNTFQSLSDGVSGPVNTLYCDNTNSEVWVGGSFNSSGNLALWSIASSAWTEIPFGGLNGPVEDISSNGSSIYFSGAFTTSYLSNSSSLVNTTSNFTSAQSAPSNTSTVGHSGYLTPVTMPSISSSAGNLTITAGPSTNQKQYSDADVLLCPGRGTWLAENNTVAQVDVKGYNYWIATGARVANAHVEGRGATAFCITSLPDNTQLNMTYTDPTTGKNETCWEYCPLSTDATIGAQDFLFTDGPRNLTGLQMELKRWIGDGPGLSSVQLLSDGEVCL
ncbi:hypothetical protein BCR39DRAFT_326154 [Naematelia encephala]|uniref:Rax2-like second domain-containing protein n=1 Tax=Naematelia encephala TaxID=71784 RepID=A0A1Y2AQS5_9TREE|nr:hypothetical protein BCR39DRAFT_326154 [Naematelia encephala]